MKKNFKLLFTALVTLAFGITGCNNPSQGGGSKEPEVASVTFDGLEKNAKLELKFGENYTLVPIITYKENNIGSVNPIWRNSNPKVTALDDGVVSAIGYGKSTISIIAGLQMASVTFTVPSEEVPPEPGPEDFTITLNHTNESLMVGATLKLTATTSEPATVTFGSSNNAIASVDNEGLITANAKGDATITASANGKTATCFITVTDSQVDPQKNVTVYFFIDFNNADPEDETGEKRLAMFQWYQDQPLKTAPIPNKPADSKAPDPAFPHFIGWSSHSIIDSKDQLWDIDNDVVGSVYVIYIFGIWSDVTAQEFTK